MLLLSNFEGDRQILFLCTGDVQLYTFGMRQCIPYIFCADLLSVLLMLFVILEESDKVGFVCFLVMHKCLNKLMVCEKYKCLNKLMGCEK